MHLPKLTFACQQVIHDWLLVLDVMVTNQSGEIVQNFFNIGHDDATPGVGRKLLKAML